ncbi:Transposase IS116/IS110/IS902 family protein [Bacillus sp. OV194]|nr:Transposase IS116/IS110/IS902 family protein [Bacillus sp. OV194]
MHSIRNDRINQINETTLVIGMDIAKQTHYACAVDDRGRELSKSFKVPQSRQGFQRFHTELVDLMKRHNKTNIYVGFEPTGHYWMNLAFFLRDRGIPFVLVNPMHVKHTKEFDDNLQSKNDQKDARLIAKMVPQGYYNVQRSMTETDQELRRGSAFKARLKKDRSSLQNRIRRWMDLYFPEFSQVIKGLGVQACAILKEAPLPADLLSTTAETLVHTLKEQGVRSLSEKKVEQLIQLAANSIGVKDSPQMARAEILSLLHLFTSYEAQIEELTKQLLGLARQLPDFECIVSIPGISEETTIEFLAETGSFTLYEHPRQLIKLAGLTLTTHSSGKYEGKKRLSKRGRKRLRAILYKATLPLLHANPPFRKLFNYYTTRKENPLTGKEALVVLCSKLLQICHGLCRLETTFDADRMMQDLPCLQPLKAA